MHFTILCTVRAHTFQVNPIGVWSLILPPPQRRSHQNTKLASLRWLNQRLPIWSYDNYVSCVYVYKNEPISFFFYLFCPWNEIGVTQMVCCVRIANTFRFGNRNSLLWCGKTRRTFCFVLLDFTTLGLFSFDRINKKPLEYNFVLPTICWLKTCYTQWRNKI